MSNDDVDELLAALDGVRKAAAAKLASLDQVIAACTHLRDVVRKVRDGVELRRDLDRAERRAAFDDLRELFEGGDSSSA